MKSIGSFRTFVFGAATLVVAAMSPLGIAPVHADEAGFGALELMASDDMDALRGRNGDVLTNVQSIQDLDATVTGGTFSANTMTTGAITIEQHALEGFSGVGIFNIFTGHNNAVGAAVGISVFLSE